MWALSCRTFDLKTRSTPSRYKEYLGAEELFCDQYLGRIMSMVVVLKLIYRLAYKLWRNGGSYPYYEIGLGFLCRRLFYSRKHRMATSRQAIRGSLHCMGAPLIDSDREVVSAGRRIIT